MRRFNALQVACTCCKQKYCKFFFVKNSQHWVGKNKIKSESKPKKQEKKKNNACYVHKMEKKKKDRQRERESRNASTGAWNTIDIRVPGKCPDLQYQDTVRRTLHNNNIIQLPMKMHASITHRDIWGTWLRTRVLLQLSDRLWYNKVPHLQISTRVRPTPSTKSELKKNAQLRCNEN